MSGDGEFLGTIGTLEEFLAVSALSGVPIDEVVDRFAERARSDGLSIGRMMLGWRLLDPLFVSRLVTWSVAEGSSITQFKHGQNETDDFRASPINAILNSSHEELRLRMSDEQALARFPVLRSFAQEGYTDYVIFRVVFGAVEVDNLLPGAGMVMSFVSERPGGFTDAELGALRRLRYMIALNLRTAMETGMRNTLASTYLGVLAGKKVLGGQIARGEGESIEAVIWYCDLRGSTALCEAMGVDAYLPLLSDYFSAIGEPVVAEGGEILDFLGDAVLAIFPLSDDAPRRACQATDAALCELDAFRKRHDVLRGREEVADVAGIAIDLGTVIYGNIGIPTRLTFSVIGPTVNKVTRIEGMTKLLREPVLVTGAIADAVPERWRPRGRYSLAGVAGETELFALSRMARPVVAA